MNGRKRSDAPDECTLANLPALADYHQISECMNHSKAPHDKIVHQVLTNFILRSPAQPTLCSRRGSSATTSSNSSPCADLERIRDPTTQRSLQAAIEFLSCATRFGYAVTNIPSPISLLYGRWRARLGDVCMETSVHPLKPSSENAVQPMCTCYLYIIISSRLSHLLHTVEHLQEDATKACELVPKLSK
jgi:hypothetical protein